MRERTNVEIRNVGAIQPEEYVQARCKRCGAIKELPTDKQIDKHRERYFHKLPNKDV